MYRIIFASLVFLAGCYGDMPQATITYFVDGSGPAVVEYFGEHGTTVENVTMPWSYSYDVYVPDGLYVLAQNRGTGPMVVGIRSNGNLVNQVECDQEFCVVEIEHE